MTLFGTLKTLFGVSGAEPTLRGSNGTIYAVSSFGVDGTTFGPDFDPGAVIDSERCRGLRFKNRYAANRQHDHKSYDSQGRFRKPGKVELTQPLIGGSLPSHYVPMDQRRPCSPYRLSRTIVRRFSSLVFGHGHFPTVRVPGDSDAEDFVAALIEAQDLPTIMLRARNKGGGCGTAVISWRFWEGTVKARVHDADSIVVHAWADREELLVEHASELKRVVRQEYDSRKREMVSSTYWQRRDWTPIADIAFLERADDGKQTDWIVDEDNTFVHGDGETHLVWIQNQPPDEEDEPADGVADCDGLWESLDSIDTLSTVLNTGTIRNLDPTLVLKLNPEMLKDPIVRKGSDNALKVGESGDAKYLELAGTAATAGLALRDKERSQVLEVAQCVVADPDQVAAAGTSGVAIRLIYAPMCSQGDVLRSQYGRRGILRLLGQQLRSARRFYPQQDAAGEWVYPEEKVEDEGVVEGETATEKTRPVEYFLELPPRPEEEDVLDADGKPTGDRSITFVDRHPGTSDALLIEWPDYFEPTAADRKAETDELMSATGAKPVMSQRTAVEIVASSRGRDPAEEQRRIDEEREKETASREAMFGGGSGGEVDDAGAPVDGTQPVGGKPAAAAPMSAQTMELIYTVNQLLAKNGDPPLLKADGTPDPDGKLPAVLFRAKMSAAGTEAGKLVGQAQGEVESKDIADAGGVPVPTPGAATAGAPPMPPG